MPQPRGRFAAVLIAVAACLPAAGAEPAAIPIDGRVLGLGGQGLAGATVELRPVLSRYEAGLREIEGRREPEPVARTVSDRQGYFLLRAPAAGVWRVVVSARGYVPAEHPVALVEETGLPVVKLSPDARLEVRASSPDGRPVAGARVHAEAVQPEAGEWQPSDRAGLTGPDGTLRLARSAGEVLRVWAAAPGRPPQEAEATPGVAVVRLAPGVARTFQTHERGSGEPKADALLWHLPSGLLLGRTGSGGEAVLDSPAKGAFSLLAATRDGRRVPFTDVLLPKHPGIRCRLGLPPAGILTGKAVAAVTRRPLHSALVWPEDDPGAFVLTDTAGSFRLPRVVEGKVALRGKARGHFGSDPLPFPAVPAILALAPAGSAAGMVVDSEGWPVAGAEVRFLEVWMEEARRTRTRPTGRFRVTGLNLDRDYVLVAAAPGYQAVVQPVALRVSGSSVAGLRAVLHRGAAASGLVVDSAGKGMAGVEVEMTLRRDARATDWPVYAEDGLYLARTGPDGRFEIPDLPAGIFELAANRQGFGTLIQRGIEIPEGAARVDVGTIAFPPGRSVEGRVVDREGRPLAGVEVWAEALGDSRIMDGFSRYLAEGPSAVTGPDGRFSLVSEDAVLWLCREGYAPRSFFLKEPADSPPEESLSFLPMPAESPSRIVLEPAGTTVRVSGRVEDESGTPMAGATVRAGNMDEQGGLATIVDGNPCSNREPFSLASETGADGRFVLQVAPMVLKVDVWAEAEGFISGTAEILAGLEDVDGLEIVLRRAAAVTGQVFAPDGTPASGAEVSIDDLLPARTDPGGVYRLDGFAPGRQVVTFSHPEHGRAFRRLDAKPGETRLDVTLDGRGQVAVRGRVSGPDGAPLGGARVESDCQCGEDTFTAPDGSFELLLEPGFLESRNDLADVQASKPGYAAAHQQVKAGNGVEGLELRLAPGLALSGRVRGVKPEELPSVSVYLQSEPEPWISQLAAVDREGNYRFQDLPPGEYLITANFLRARRVRVVLEPEAVESTLDLEIPGEFRVQGTVFGPDGRPARRAFLNFRPLGESGGYVQAGTGNDGRFVLPLTEGSYAVNAAAPGFSPRLLEEPLIVEGSDVEGLEIRLQPGVVLKGRVLGWRPGIANPQVTATSSGGLRQVDVAPDGTYRIEDAGPGTWHVTATARDEEWSTWERSSEAEIEIPSGAAEATLDLDLSLGDHTLSGRVESGLEPFYAEVSVLRADGTPLIEQLSLGEDGLFRVSGLSPGLYRLRIEEHLHHRKIEQEVDLSGDREVVVDLRR